MMHTNDNKLMILLQSEWILIDASVATLLHSVEKCKSIGIKRNYSFEEQESFDSLTSKFNRTSDLFTQKILRTTWMLLHESFVPFIDLLHTAEKLGILANADQMMAIRDIRNQIAHEYIPEAICESNLYNFPEVIEMTQQLVDNINCCNGFLKNRNWIN